MNDITGQLLKIVSDWDGKSFKGAYNIREDSGCAGGVTAHYVRLCALYLNILLGNFLSALNPLYSLGGSHIEVGIYK